MRRYISFSSDEIAQLLCKEAKAKGYSPVGNTLSTFDCEAEGVNIRIVNPSVLKHFSIGVEIDSTGSTPEKLQQMQARVCENCEFARKGFFCKKRLYCYKNPMQSIEVHPERSCSGWRTRIN